MRILPDAGIMSLFVVGLAFVWRFPIGSHDETNSPHIAVVMIPIGAVQMTSDVDRREFIAVLRAASPHCLA
jgi:hypothetical protein